VANCSDFQASNLQISHVPVGIVMSNVDEASITGINFSDTGVAFSVYGSNHIRFANNQLVRSGSWWFSWFAHVSNSVITRNSISPTPYGIGITHGQNITVSENYMSDNIGLYLESSSGILVYHNNFLRPATDYQGGQNRWDNDYPSGGNYWTSFNGVDTCNGPNQDICISEALRSTRNRVSSICTNFNYITKLRQIPNSQNRSSSRLQCIQPYPVKYPPERDNNCKQCKACNPAQCDSPSHSDV